MKKTVRMNVTETEDTITITPYADCNVTGSCTILDNNVVDNGATATVVTPVDSEKTITVNSQATASCTNGTASACACATTKSTIVEAKKKPKFYIAVCDKTFYIGKKGEMKRLYEPDENCKTSEYNDTVYDERLIGDKFVGDPKLAMLMAAIENKKDTYNPEIRHEFFNSLKFNKHHNVYVYDRYLTLRTKSTAKPIHMERFERGEYELILEHGEVQLLSTNVETIDLDAVKKEY